MAVLLCRIPSRLPVSRTFSILLWLLFAMGKCERLDLIMTLSILVSAVLIGMYITRVCGITMLEMIPLEIVTVFLITVRALRSTRLPVRVVWSLLSSLV